MAPGSPAPIANPEEAPMPLLDPQVSAKIGTLQTLDDAIAYRLTRLQVPCQACGPDGRCPEHRHDEHLLASYQERYAAAFQDALAGMDPADIALIMQPGDDLPPTAGAMSVAVLARLKELAADGPVILDLGDGPVLIEMNGPVITEHPLQPGSSGD
jgi:hypothetical protein